MRHWQSQLYARGRPKLGRVDKLIQWIGQYVHLRRATLKHSTINFDLLLPMDVGVLFARDLVAAPGFQMPALPTLPTLPRGGAGELKTRRVQRNLLIEPLREKVEEWVDASHGRIYADVVLRIAPHK